MVTHLLDTNICIYIIKKRPEEVLKEFKTFAQGEVGVSSIVLAELHFGASKSVQVEQNRLALDHFVTPLIVLPFDAPAARAYGDIRAYLERNGTPIGALDTLIAAHALSQDLTLVTNNVKEFSRIPGLKVENWVNQRA